MWETFQKIKEEYNAFYASLFLHGKAPLRNTPLGYWGVAAADDLWELFQKIQLHTFSRFLDLGSGDGKVVFIASLFTSAEGVEIDSTLIQRALRMRAILNLPVAFHCQDYLQHDLSKFDILFLNPDKPLHALEKKLQQEMRKDAKLILYDALYTPLQMPLEQRFFINGVDCRVYGKE